METEFDYNHHMESLKEERLPSTNYTKVQEPTIQLEATVAGRFSRKLFQILFYAHLILIAILTIFLTIRGLLSARNHHFHPQKWYPPLFTSIGFAAIVALTWHWVTYCNPSKAIRAAFWLSPLLTCAVGILLVLVGSAGSLAAGVIAVISSIIQSLYACWVTPRFEYATKVLSASIAFPPAETTALVILSITAAVFYSCFLVSGIGGATATGTLLDVLFILVILLSLVWSMQVMKNMLQVTVSRIRYINFACGMDMDTRIAFRDTIKYSMGSVSIGSALVPVLGVIRGSARAISLVIGGTDEFLFSCADCYSAVASTLITYGNRWGFVHVGMYDKGFVQASNDTWEMFRMAQMEPLIDSDLTSSFCLLCGLTGGGICSLAGGTWALVLHKSYATEVTLYAFLIGYFMCRVAMAWPQACVSAYYVAYAENPQNPRFDSTIPARIQELRRSQG
ncbi:Choline_transpo domain-containing protein [Cephalotus follicularis]|uniref:Choline transporter-like protein n=1 Tax=Cephalotus follicularis TaxID=3775 RepID=A0A1Q3CRA5_CEPFO|nr:Choline_transpo domain-containing protein [Cephalotus follicularis]